MIKPNGYLIISDFSYVNIPKRDFFFGMYTTTEEKEEPEEFSPFNFLIDEAPDFNFKIYNIPSYRMMQAGKKAGFSRISYISQYPAQTEKENIVIQDYLKLNPDDYLIKFEF